MSQKTPGTNWPLVPYGKGHGGIERAHPPEVAVEQFIHQQNLEHYRRLLAAPDQTDEVRRQTILKLLAEEMSKDSIPGPANGT
ncbi:hypothetical protein [Bradyrhizobium sp.]|jgi:hypothetical protein|uniref:hypothetical protein n=1 Tax=Bradyrhizobium sp. TaxID=376 RepID=UPI003D0F13B0